MALTKAQWLTKLKLWVPGNLFEEEKLQLAHWSGIAAVLEQLQIDAENHAKETFILQAVGDFLDAHGDERKVERLPGEVDSIYAERIRIIDNKSDCPSIKELVDKFLIQGEATIQEHEFSSAFADRNIYANRGVVLTDVRYNAFSIVVDEQKGIPESFVDRDGVREGVFATREDFLGSTQSSQKVFDLIVDAVDKEKALGIAYRVIERTG